MAKNNILSKIVYSFFKIFLSVPENPSREITPHKKILIIRQHNQLGDLLASVSLFRALKGTYPGSHISLVVSPINYPGMVKNKFLERIYIFDKKKLFSPVYLYRTIKFFREEYDLAIVPIVVSM
jgi:ADP-heptose:LPS heptosyltransferase